MKSILFIAFLAIAAISCDTPESTTGSDISQPPPMSDSSMISSEDTVTTTPVDTTSTIPEPMPEPTPEPVDTTNP